LIADSENEAVAVVDGSPRVGGRVRERVCTAAAVVRVQRQEALGGKRAASVSCVGPANPSITTKASRRPGVTGGLSVAVDKAPR
jgi:hypothetical protein